MQIPEPMTNDRAARLRAVNAGKGLIRLGQDERIAPLETITAAIRELEAIRRFLTGERP